jgi:hypothetical protein
MQVVVDNDQFVKPSRKITTTGGANDRALRGRERSSQFFRIWFAGSGHGRILHLWVMWVMWPSLFNRWPLTEYLRGHIFL